MDRRVTPPKRVTSPTWGPPPQALKRINFSRQKKNKWSHFCEKCVEIKYYAKYCIEFNFRNSDKLTSFIKHENECFIWFLKKKKKVEAALHFLKLASRRLITSNSFSCIMLEILLICSTNQTSSEIWQRKRFLKVMNISSSLQHLELISETFGKSWVCQHTMGPSNFESLFGTVLC